MATESVDVILVYGKQKIPVSLEVSRSPLDSHSLTVNHLCQAVHQYVHIKPESQKLIYRGRTLFKSFDPEDDNMKKTLSSCGMKNGDRIMVFGKPSKDEMESNDRDEKNADDALMKVLDQHQKKIEEICMLCKDMFEKIEDNPGTVEDWRKHNKFFLCQSELSLQEVTRLDATPGDLSQSQGYKIRRKALVNKLLENMTLCDNQVSQLTSSIKAWERSHQSHSHSRSAGKRS